VHLAGKSTIFLALDEAINVHPKLQSSSVSGLTEVWKLMLTATENLADLFLSKKAIFDSASI
jgi:hypothetical protein